MEHHISLSLRNGELTVTNVTTNTAEACAHEQKELEQGGRVYRMNVDSDGHLTFCELTVTKIFAYKNFNEF